MLDLLKKEPLTGPEFFALLNLRGRLRLEIAGMNGRGQTAYAQAKRLLKLKGNREKVLAQLCEIIEQRQLQMAAVREDSKLSQEAVS